MSTDLTHDDEVSVIQGPPTQPTDAGGVAVPVPAAPAGVAIPESGYIELTAPAKEAPKIGVGSGTALAGIVAAWGAAITAAIAASLDDTPFYADPGVNTLIITAVVATIAFLTNRSWQANNGAR